MQDANWKPSHSAEVDLWLDCGEHGKVRLSQASDTFVIATNAVRLPPCNGTIILVVDGQKFERPIELVNGMSETNREAMVLTRDPRVPF